MGAEFYCLMKGKPQGPVTANELKRLAQEGRLSGSDFVRKGPEGEWVPAQKVKGLFDGAVQKVPSDKSSVPSSRMVLLMLCMAGLGLASIGVLVGLLLRGHGEPEGLSVSNLQTNEEASLVEERRKEAETRAAFASDQEKALRQENARLASEKEKELAREKYAKFKDTFRRIFKKQMDFSDEYAAVMKRCDAAALLRAKALQEQDVQQLLEGLKKVDKEKEEIASDLEKLTGRLESYKKEILNLLKEQHASNSTYEDVWNALHDVVDAQIWLWKCNKRVLLLGLRDDLKNQADKASEGVTLGLRRLERELGKTIPEAINHETEMKDLLGILK